MGDLESPFSKGDLKEFSILVPFDFDGTLSVRPIDIDIAQRYAYNVHMSDIRFEWGESKSRENKRKHGVSFDEAQTVFLDENAIRYYDPDHSEDEDRFVMLGMSFKLRVLVVCHCYRLDDKVIRIVSARKANKKEAAVYWR